MADDGKVTNALIYATLQEIQERLTRMEQGIRINSGKLSAMENYLAGFYQSLRIRDEEIDQHRGRLEALEQRDTDDPAP